MASPGSFLHSFKDVIDGSFRRVYVWVGEWAGEPSPPLHKKSSHPSALLAISLTIFFLF